MVGDRVLPGRSRRGARDPAESGSGVVGVCVWVLRWDELCWDIDREMIA